MVRNRIGPLTSETRDIRSRSELLSAIWSKIVESTGDPLLVDFMADLIDVYQVPARDSIALAKAVQHYSVHYIKFFREYPERIASPTRTIAWGFGDCDDKTVFVACCLRTFRIPIRLTELLLEYKGRRFGHVYPEAHLADDWTVIESVRPYPWGHDPSIIARQKGLLVDMKRIGDSPEGANVHG